MGALSYSDRELQESERTRAPRSCRQGGTMNDEVDVIAGIGLAQKTRKSHWPARLDLVQSASGLFLGLFMWGHMAFVSSILISKDAMWWVTKMFEGQFFFGSPYPAIVSVVVGSSAVCRCSAATMSARKTCHWRRRSPFSGEK